MSRETYYWTCPYCGANLLGPRESCDCRREHPPEDYKLVQKGGDENAGKTD